MKNNYLQEAIRIGDHLLTTAERDEHGLSWRTADLDTATNALNWNKSEGLYSGISGIALFLIALSQVTNDKKYLQAAKHGMQWVEWYCKEHPTNYYALFTGRLGVSFAYIKLAEVTKNKTYLSKALIIAKDSLTFLEKPYTVNDLINGISGTLLGLLHLHAATNETWLLEYIEKYIDVLLKNARFDKAGLYWDTTQNEIRPLCGFSHGSGGIGYVFLELGHYFHNPAFYYVSEQAFAYENYYFDDKIKNWPDFRINMYTEKKVNKFQKLYQKGEMEAFTQSGDMNAWCHGAAGIGLSRLRAKQLLKNKIYSQDIKRAYDKTLHITLSSFTLCHGNGGNAEFFIEAYLLQKKQTYLNEAEKIANGALLQKKNQDKYTPGVNYEITNNAEDISLFNGIAGIGYFLLRLSNPEKIASILAPKISNTFEQTDKKMRSYTLPSIKHILISSMFTRTMEKIERFASFKLKNYLQNSKSISSELDAFVAFIKKLIPNFYINQQRELNNLFLLELQKVEMFTSTSSLGLLFIKDRINSKKAIKMMNLSDETILKKKLQLSTECKLIIVNNPEIKRLLLKMTPYGVEELQISEFCYIVLKEFAKEKTVVKTIKLITNLYLSQKDMDKRVIDRTVFSQIKEAIKNGILLQKIDNVET